MAQEEIIEYNKRCAEFLGLLKFDNLGNNKYKFGNQIFTINNDITNDPKEWLINLYCNPKNTGHFKFYSDWNWIHEVIEGIEKLRYLVVIQSNFCQIQEIGVKENNFKPYIIASLYGNDKKEAVVEAINQFLIWYNVQTNQ